MAKFLAKYVPTAIGGQENCVRFVLGNGLEVVCDASKLPEPIREAAMYHGLSQKIGDKAAGFAAAKDFAGAFHAMQGAVDNLEGNSWNARGGGGGSDLVAAIAKLKGLDITEASDMVEAWDDEKMKKILGHPEVKKTILAIKAERAAAIAENAEDDLDDLLDA